jgi:hypothetical protein
VVVVVCVKSRMMMMRRRRIRMMMMLMLTMMMTMTMPSRGPLPSGGRSSSFRGGPLLISPGSRTSLVSVQVASHADLIDDDGA